MLKFEHENLSQGLPLIYLYPANKMENLLALVDKIQRISPLPVFALETIVVQNQGMKHWLNLSLAQMRGVSMNIDYALPSQFLWKLIRSLASGNEVPEQSPYSREVLSWRIFILLQSEAVTKTSDFKLATRYWQGENNPLSDDNKRQQGLLKCYQLATQLADLYEQYLIFRPNWIHQWQNNDFVYSDNLSGDVNPDIATQFLWQGKLWALLTQNSPYDPVEFIAAATKHIPEHKALLPSRLFFFGINAMPPIWLNFIHELSQHIDIHFFHLNPCYAYWGDLLTEKQAAKNLQRWCSEIDDISYDVGNPLLANLGQQGREFMALLQDVSTIDIEAFEDFSSDHEPIDNQASVLQSIQADILQLKDARKAPKHKLDDSIVVTSAHSALREVQALHDWLLHQFNQDPSLSPKDVLVMCPQVEDYAPYVHAVFAQGWQHIPNSTPPLPCSIADRISKNAEPIVSAFASLLTLPDSRFNVSELMSYLRLPAMQLKFGLTDLDIDKIVLWIDQASIHWGLNAVHKSQILNIDSSGANGVAEQFTWEDGLGKLLLGLAYSDTQSLYQDNLALPNIEGSDSLLLGKLILLLEQLSYFSKNMRKARNAMQWQVYLTTLLEELFITNDDAGFDIITQAIEGLVTYCHEAGFDGDIDWVIINEFLNHHFNQTDPGRQFMIGQVTFCSMLPMRSIPFKVIAILGLNDGDFPRQRQPMGFDLLSISPSKLGDRSRRGDDRYLFLEALISARKNLYLSYQGRNIKNNSTKQPSLVLQELLQYLTHGYGWSFTHDDKSNKTNENSGSEGDYHAQLRELPMQPFSVMNYQGKWPSFDPKWFSLNHTQRVDEKRITESKFSLTAQEVNEALLHSKVTDLVRFFQHPAKYFAQKQLSLYLDQRLLTVEDTEPFSFNALETYNLRENLLVNSLTAPAETKEAMAEQIIRSAELSGKFPDLPHTHDKLKSWETDSALLSAFIQEQSEHQVDVIHVVLPIRYRELTIECAVSFPVAGNKLVFYRSSSAKWKDLFTLYLHQMLLVLWQSQQKTQRSADSSSLDENQSKLLNVTSTYGYYFDTKKQAPQAYCYNMQDEASIAHLEILLAYYEKGLQQPLLLNGELGETFLNAKSFNQASFELLWSDVNSFNPLGDDPYIKYFWPQCPQFSDIAEDIKQLYAPAFTLRERVKL